MVGNRSDPVLLQEELTIVYPDRAIQESELGELVHEIVICLRRASSSFPSSGVKSDVDRSCKIPMVTTTVNTLSGSSQHGAEKPSYFEANRERR